MIKCHRTGEVFTVVFVDIDGLKAMNDTQGHEAGDRLIVEVAEAVRSVLREYDVVIRYGGDEFVCGLQGLTATEARRRFESLQQKSSAFGASVGVAQLTPSDSLPTLISRADTGMYKEKLGRTDHR